MFLLVIILLFHCFLSVAQQEKHSLHFKFTVLSKADTFPEFRQIKHYSNEDQSWVRSSLTADDWTEAPEAPDSRDWFLHQIRTLSDCTQCSGAFNLHVLQRMIGCELEKLPDGTVSLRAFDEYGFDGEDFMAFDSDTLQWIDKNPKAKETKIKWDQQTERNQFLKQYLSHSLTQSFSQSVTSPDVRVFVKNAPDQSKLVLSCLATGFYPRDIEMYIRLDESVLVNQTSSGIRPNADGSFQMRTSMEIEANRTGIYHCLVIHSSLTQTQPIVTVWTIYQQKSSECLWSFIAGIIAAAVVIFLFVIGCCIYQKKKSYGKL
uniref:Ig-like domain-containing protein n=1 Tax=Sinocyclocheilus anshuiensis TaxID=1608454 RepID=A0A671KQ18_9TELE